MLNIKAGPGGGGGDGCFCAGTEKHYLETMSERGHVLNDQQPAELVEMFQTLNSSIKYV